MWMHRTHPPLPAAPGLIFLIVLMACAFHIASAQNVHGTLRGGVQDASGAVVSNTSVSLHATEAPMERTRTTGDR